MDVLFITHGVGGRQSAILNTIKCICYHSDRNIQKHILFLDRIDKSEFVIKELNKLGVKVHTIPSKQIISTFFHSIFKIKHIDPDIIHTHHPLSNVFGKVIGKLTKTSVIISARRNSARGLSTKAVFTEKLTDKLATIKLNVSKGVQESFDSISHSYAYGDLANGYRNFTIHNFIDTRIQEVPTSDLSILKDHTKTTVGTVGSLTKQKGFDDLIKSVDNPILNDVEVLIAGDGPQRKQLEKLTEQRNLSDQVTFLGRIDETVSFFKNIDIFVLPSRWEGMSKALLEAMYSGTPCISTNVEGSREVIIDEFNGLLVPPNSPNRLSNNIKKIMSDDSLKNELGQNGKKTVENQHSVQNGGRIYSELYREIHEVLL